jgi:hypothetical protein
MSFREKDPKIDDPLSAKTDEQPNRKLGAYSPVLE